MGKNMSTLKDLNAEWIWLPQDNEDVNQYVDFRHEFTIKKKEDMNGEDGFLHISVDTEYAVWLNGIFVDFNQYDDFPDHKSYDVLDIKEYLKEGKNVLCIRGYYQGRNSYQYIKGRPALIYAVKIGEYGVISGTDTLCRQSPSYRSGHMEMVSPQLLYTFEYDAQGEDKWLSRDYVPDMSWKRADIKKEMKERIVLYPRPIKKLAFGETPEGKITAQGFFYRSEEARGATPAERIQRDYLSARLPGEVFSGDRGYELKLPSAEGLPVERVPDGNEGAYILIDLQQEEAGLFELEIDGEDGAVIEAAYGQHLDDLRVRAFVGGRNFAFKYTCREGRQRFVHYMKRIAGRFIQLHISNIKKGVTLYYAGIRPVNYPIEYKGRFSCGDRLFNKIYEISVRTLQLCMHEHYEDTPWREQALYAMDSRNQALCGYYAFGEYDFPESSFFLFTEGLREDGSLEICAPAKDRITIPSFSLGWILAVRDLLLYSGRMDVARKLFPFVKRMLNTYMENMENHLMRTPASEQYWNFYEWADGLEDGWLFEPPFKRGDYNRLDAPLNLFLCLALEAGVEFARWLREQEIEAQYFACLSKLRKAIHQTFWDDSARAYKTYVGKNCRDHYAELTQALALLSVTVPEEAIARELREKLSRANNSLVRTTLSYALYKYEALLQEQDKYGAIVFDDIAKDWGYMLYNKATSFWETVKGADDFDKGGSLCHGWSAIPAYFFYAYILGVRPLEPGFRRFSALPVKQGADRASGIIPTPYGDIRVDWEKRGSEVEYHIQHPAAIARV